MLIHQITVLPNSGSSTAKEFGEKTSDCDLIEKMKKKLDLIKKPHGYPIMSITNPTVKIDT